MAPSRHLPVMAAETLEALAPESGQTFVDGTLGGGGHARLLAEAVGPSGQVIALDRDPEAVQRAEATLTGLPVRLIHADFRDIARVLQELGLPAVDGVLLDLGLSSDQLADESRGFSFSASGPLDLRFDPSSGEPARRLVNRLSQQRLADTIYRFGEERHSRRIARAILRAREKRDIETAAELAEIVRRAVPGGRREKIHPATRTFQALRIAVNDELGALEQALREIPSCVRPGARVAVVSFHSLEDRLVKNAFRDDDRYDPLTRRPQRPSDEEVARNPRARSARLRAATIGS